MNERVKAVKGLVVVEDVEGRRMRWMSLGAAISGDTLLVE